MADEDEWIPETQAEAPLSQGSDQRSQPSDEWVPENAPPADEWRAAPQGQDEWVPESRLRQGEVPEESRAAAMLRSGAKAILPTIGAIGAGAAGGMIAGLPGMFAAGAGGAYLMDKAQNWLLDKFGMNNPEQEAANERAYPLETGFASTVPALAAFPVAGAGLVQRGVQAAIGGGMDLLFGGDLKHAAGVAMGSAAAGAPNKLGSTLIQRGEQAGAYVRPEGGRKLSTLLAEAKGNAEAQNTNPETGAAPGGAAAKTETQVAEAADQAARASVQTPAAKGPGSPVASGTAHENAPPLRDVDIGNPGSKPTESSREGAKDFVAPEGTVEPRPLGIIDPDIAQAMRGKMNELEQGRAGQQEPAPVSPVPPRAPAAPPPEIEALQQRAARRAMAAENPSEKLVGPEPGFMDELNRATTEAVGGKGAPPQEPPTPPRAEPPPPDIPNITPANKEGLAGLARGIKRIFAPTTLTGTGQYKNLARETGNEINRAHGKYEQMAQQIMRDVEPHNETYNNMSGDRMRQLVNRMQGGDHFPNFVPTQEEERAVAPVRAGFDKLGHELQEAGVLEHFIKNYLPGLYKNGDSDAAKEFARKWAARGDRGMTKEKIFPTYEDARNAGLEPLTNDPREMLARYAMRARDTLAAEQFKKDQMARGLIRYMEHPLPGWEPLRDSGQGNLPLHAPEDMAAVYNNYVDKGLRAQHAKLYDAIQHTLNAWTMVELGVNGYHAVTMGHEGIADDFSRAVNLAASGKFKAAGSSLVKAPLAPYLTQKTGKQAIERYLGGEDSPVMNLMRDADVRFVGRAHAPETMVSARKSFIDFFNDPASVKSQLRKAGRDIAEDFAGDKDVMKVLNAASGNAARAIQTISHPLFDVYIPRMKAGAILKHVNDLLLANPNLNLTDRNGADYKYMLEQVRKHVNSVDNRFGEAIMDHLFLNRAVQQGGQLGMRAFGWFINSVKEIGGGSYSAGQGALNTLAGREGNLRQKLSLSSEHQDPRIAYLIGFPMALGLASTLVQFAGTGGPPQTAKDFILPKTGAKVPGYGGKGQVDETLLMPGYAKDVFAWMFHPFEEAYNKLNGMITTGYEVVRGVDGLGRPYVDPKGDTLQQVKDRMTYLLTKLGPISLHNLMRGTKETSNIPTWAQVLGFRAPGAYLQDPEGFKRGQEKRLGSQFNAREKSQMRQEQQYGREYIPRKSGVYP